MKKCSCGLETPVIKNGVGGRMNANIVLPNGKVFPCGAFCFVEPVLSKFKTFKVKQYQVVQRKIDEIEILLVIDEDLRNTGSSVEKIGNSIEQIYKEKTGPGVKIIVREVDEIKHPRDAGKPAPIVSITRNVRRRIQGVGKINFYENLILSFSIWIEVWYMREYTIKKGHNPDISALVKKYFGVEGNIFEGIRFEFEDIGKIYMKQEKNVLYVETEPPKKTSGDFKIIRKWNDFLFEATGKDAKERKKELTKIYLTFLLSSNLLKIFSYLL